MPSPRKLLLAALTFILYPQISDAQSPQDIEQLFGVNKIVPDLLPSFKPIVALEVTYNATVIPGEIFNQAAAALPPKLGLQFAGKDDQYLFIMVDPDDQPIPNPNKTFTQFLHMIAPSLTMNHNVDSQGFRQLVNSTPAIVDYLGPGAKTGSPLHRYVFLLYLQPANFSMNIQPPERKNFNLTQFVGMAGLTTPIGGNMMLVGDASSGPSTVPGSNPTAAPTSTAAASSSSSLQVGFGGVIGFLIFICGALLYGL